MADAVHWSSSETDSRPSRCEGLCHQPDYEVSYKASYPDNDTISTYIIE